jgi:hypothetical protein
MCLSASSQTPAHPRQQHHWQNPHQPLLPSSKARPWRVQRGLPVTPLSSRMAGMRPPSSSMPAGRQRGHSMRSSWRHPPRCSSQPRAAGRCSSRACQVARWACPPSSRRLCRAVSTHRLPRQLASCPALPAPLLFPPREPWIRSRGSSSSSPRRLIHQGWWAAGACCSHVSGRRSRWRRS